MPALMHIATRLNANPCDGDGAVMSESGRLGASRGAVGGQGGPAAAPEPRCYSHLQVVWHNVPYVAMVFLGSAVFLAGFARTAAGWSVASAYCAYGFAGALWIVLFVCPYCRFHGTRLCPCGYGLIAARLRETKDPSRFAEKFRKHIPVIVPLWVVPPAAAGYFLYREPSTLMTLLLAAFLLDAFLLLPLLSRKRACVRCPQRQGCPWMRGHGRIEFRRPPQ